MNRRLNTPLVVVYTARIGNYEDPVWSPRCKPQHGVVYRLLTDNPTYSVPGWTTIGVPKMTHPIHHARKLKILAHETVTDAPYSLWIDASMELFVDPLSIVERWMPPAHIVAVPHPDRINYAQEGEEVIRLDLAPAGLVRPQVAAYQHAGFLPDEQTTLTSTGFLLRRHTAQVAYFNQTWWEAYTRAGHTRDQVSVDYALWATSLTPQYCGQNYRVNPYVRYHRMRRPTTVAAGDAVELPASC